METVAHHHRSKLSKVSALKKVHGRGIGDIGVTDPKTIKRTMPPSQVDGFKLVPPARTAIRVLTAVDPVNGMQATSESRSARAGSAPSSAPR